MGDCPALLSNWYPSYACVSERCGWANLPHRTDWFLWKSIYAPQAQLVEHLSYTQLDLGSSPRRSTTVAQKVWYDWKSINIKLAT